MPALSIGEATSVLSAAVVTVTFFIGRVSVSKTSSAKEQRTEDKLDSLCGDTSEIKDGVKEINRKLDDHGKRLTKVEQQVITLFNRLDRVEKNYDLHHGIGGSD
ncbi:MAG: hypothetical protein KHW77_06515 [Adlercreutzia equolifaciens]|nr:hypothetical protein [Adlercreutzia equolifaciens]